jgi:hypothetical protein
MRVDGIFSMRATFSLQKMPGLPKPLRERKLLKLVGAFSEFADDSVGSSCFEKELGRDAFAVVRLYLFSNDDDITEAKRS